MKSFDFKDVTLNDGMLKKVLDDTMEFYLKIPNDNILKYMRESAGRKAPGVYYTGWYPKSRGLALIGQWLSAFSRMYAISANEAFRKKAVFLADEFWSCYDAAASSELFLQAVLIMIWKSCCGHTVISTCTALIRRPVNGENFWLILHTVILPVIICSEITPQNGIP